ncbi:MAG: CHAT domain-containing protein [Sphingomonadales bacterium]|nr:CHAT domain-containing protein [Sphingomonadales bacterium]
MKRRLASSLSIIALAALPSPAQAGRPTPPDQAELGRDGKGDPCAISRFWEDPGATDPFSVSYSMTCRGATATRHLGVARFVKASQTGAIDALLDCGAASDVTIAALGAGRSRRCFDKLLGLETVETSVDLNGYQVSVSAIATAQGPAEEALRMLAGKHIDTGDRGRTVAPAVDVSKLAAAPAASGALGADAGTEVALEQGLRFIRQGLHMEASRVFNDALSRLPANAAPDTRVELLLAAGLADSNLRFFDSAQTYFQRADQQLAANSGMPNAAVLARKRRTYGALDLLNRREFNSAVGAFDQLASAQAEAGQPLLDPTTVRALNQPSGETRNGMNGLVETPDVGSLSQLVIDAQSHWARSVALLAQNKPSEAAAELAEADRNFDVFQREKVDQQQVRWLEARIERQRARLLLRTGNRTGAIAALDKAVGALRAAEANGAVGPALAETELERAGTIARGGGDTPTLLANFEGAVDSLISADAQGAVMPPSMEQYLDLLVRDANEHPDGRSPERFFRALQAVGDPAIARQFVELQSVITADPRLAARVQDEQDLVREITRLRFEVTAAQAAGDNGKATTLDTQKQKLEGDLVNLQTELNGNKAYNSVNDAPVTIDELRHVLQPGEAYFKLTKVRNYAFGILIDAQGAVIYRVKNPMVEVEPIADQLRDSIDGGGAKLPVFKVGYANALYNLLIGPVGDRMLAAKALIVDANGPLQKLPVGVLVADRDSVTRFAQSSKTNQYDYSQVNFLARRLSISTALSPRSLMVGRSLGPSGAPLPFMGFAQHMPTPASAAFGNTMVSVGTGCEAEERAIAELTRELKPIDARELTRAGAALGLSNVPELTGAAFTDTAVKARSDLDQFQVLHFATHGLTEGQWGCAKSPPALVTSMDGKGSDSILSFDEIAKLRLDANLVVLSACDTAAGISAAQGRSAGQEEAGATLEGLVRAFLAANARAVLSTYWPISDAGESELLIEDFYRSARSGTIGDALRSAQDELIANPKSSHPLYWAPFFIVGDAQKPLLTGAAKAQIVIVPAAATVLAGVSPQALRR